LGSDIDTISVSGVATHAYRLERNEGAHSAAALRKRLNESGSQSPRIVVVGGAETAVEVAGEIKTAWPRSMVTMISRSRCGDFRGSRVENAVRTALTELGVSLIDHEMIKEVRASEIVTASGRAIPFDVCVWSGGLRSSAIAHDAGIAADSKGRIWVDPNLRSTSHPHIFAVGDAAHPIAPTGAPYRLSAFAALVSGAYAADAIIALRQNKRLRPFSFSTFGQGIAIGRSGVGFFSYPDDQQRLFIVRGATARHIRNFFVWLVSYVLKIERKIPGFFSGRAGVACRGKKQMRRCTKSLCSKLSRQHDP
jgi:NADH dehydrogenase